MLAIFSNIGQKKDFSSLVLPHVLLHVSKAVWLKSMDEIRWKDVDL